MAYRSMVNGLTKAEENAALKWLEKASELSDKSAVHAKNVIKIIRGMDGLMGLVLSHAGLNRGGKGTKT